MGLMLTAIGGVVLASTFSTSPSLSAQAPYPSAEVASQAAASDVAQPERDVPVRRARAFDAAEAGWELPVYDGPQDW